MELEEKMKPQVGGKSNQNPVAVVRKEEETQERQISPQIGKKPNEIQVGDVEQ